MLSFVKNFRIYPSNELRKKSLTNENYKFATLPRVRYNCVHLYFQRSQNIYHSLSAPSPITSVYIMFAALNIDQTQQKSQLGLYIWAKSHLGWILHGIKPLYTSQQVPNIQERWATIYTIPLWSYLDGHYNRWAS